MKTLLGEMGREQLLLAFAYGLFLACTSVTLWGGYLQYVDEPVGDGAFTWEYLARSLSLPTSLLVAGVAAYRFPKARRWRSPAIALALLLAGAGAVALDAAAAPGVGWSLVAAGFCFGWASGILFCDLQEVVASQKVFSADIIVFLAAGVSAALFFAVELMPSNAAPFAVTFGLIPASVILVWLSQRRVALVEQRFIPHQFCS